MRIVLAALVLLGSLSGCLTQEGDLLGPKADEPADPPAWGDENVPIRPGASLGGYCTFNFLWYDAVEGTPYIGTAGHCTSELGEVVELPGYGAVGSVVFDSDLSESFPDVDPAVDFSLIRLHEGLEADAHPRMLGHDGPTGTIALDELAAGDVVELHGYGILLGQNDRTRDRSGVLVDWDDRYYVVDMPAVNGDSGAPLLHQATGQALGIVSHYGFGATPPSTDEGPHLPFILEQLAVAGFGDVVLATV